MELLFFLEILSERLRFNNRLNLNSHGHKILLEFTFDDINLEITEEDDQVKKQGNETKDKIKELEFNYGKSVLFPCKCEELLTRMRESPLILTISTQDDKMKIARAEIPWTELFTYMVENCEGNTLPPVTHKNCFKLTDDIGVEVGEATIFTRLSCCGRNIQTNFKVAECEDGKKFLFKSPNPVKKTVVSPLKHDAIRAVSQPQMISSDMKTIDLKSPFAASTPNVIEHRRTFSTDFTSSCSSVAPGSGSDTLVWRKKVENVMFGNPVHQISQIQKLTYTPSRNMSRVKFHRFGSVTTLDHAHVERTLCNGCQQMFGDSPLRLNGGNPIFDDLPTLKVPTPADACKDLMTEVDECLQAFKDALGPCGRSSCPFARNVTGEICKRVCDCSPISDSSPLEENSPLLEKFTEPDSMFPECYRNNLSTSVDKPGMVSACGIPNCPHNRDPNRKTCPLSRLHVAKEPNCNKTTFGLTYGLKCDKCPFPLVAKELPPIHWECPEPLPKGRCQNPSCPYTPSLLRRKIPPCGNLDCKHSSSGCICCKCVIPPPCGNPACPNQRVTCRPCPEVKCNNPNCPHAPPKEDVEQKPSPAARCSCNENGADDCNNPFCPFKLTHICGITDCPFVGGVDRRRKKCGNDCCGSKNPSLKGGIDSNDDNRIRGGCDEGGSGWLRIRGGCDGKMRVCAGEKCCEDQQGVDACGSTNPSLLDCGSINQDKDDDCANPNCPFKSTDFCTDETCKGIHGPPSTPVCNSPDCPFRPRTGTSSSCRFDKNAPFECNDPCCPWAVPCPPCPGCAPCPYTIPCPYENPCSYIYPQLTAKSKRDVCDKSEKSAKTDDKPCDKSTCASAGGSKSCKSCSKVKNAAVGSTATNENKPQSRATTEGIKTISAASSAATPKALNRMKGRKSKQFAYFIGDQYPGNTVGHNKCVIPGKNVPSNRGWSWNLYDPGLNMKKRRGWRPGVIGRTIAAKIQQYWLKRGIKSLTVPPTGRRRFRGVYESSSEESVAPQSTLQVKKRKGVYWVTMNPLKDPYQIADNENPYMDCTPMQFKITKRDNKQCFCEDDDKEDSTDSELDIDFTPPAGIIRPERLKKKKTIVHVDTQYDLKDLGPSAGAKGGKGKKGGKNDKKGKGGKGKTKK